MPTNATVGDVEAVLDRRLAAADRLLLVNPGEHVIARLVETLVDREDPPRVSVLAGEDRLKAVLEDFLVASRAADLVERDGLELRTIERPPDQCLVVTPAAVAALVSVGDGVGELDTESADFVEAANDYYEDVMAGAEEYTLRTPPLSRIRETLKADIGPETAADFDAVLESLDRVSDGADSLDEVAISILVAARNRELLYDISKWGEDVGLASKATFSRTKTTLEEADVVGTEKVPIQVGRPRLRLMLGDERLAEADPGEMAARASQMLDR